MRDRIFIKPIGCFGRAGGKMIDYNEISYTEIEDCIEDAKKGCLVHIGKDTQKEKLIL